MVSHRTVWVIGYALAALAGCNGSIGDAASPPDPAGSGGSGHGGANAASGATGGGGTDQPPEPQQGLLAQYFNAYLDPVLQRVEPTLDNVWGSDAPGPGVGADQFSARWTGFLVPPESGDYHIAIESDDGVRLWIGDQLVINDWNGHFVTRNEATVTLDASSPIPIRIDYFELDLDASLRLLWSSPTIPEEIVPQARLLAPTEIPGELGGPKPPFANPVVPFDCPDPGVLAVPDADPPGYYAVCTGGPFPIRFSRSLLFWQDTGASVLPDGKPPWAANGYRNWAPEIHRVGNHFVVYYTTVNGADTLSIGAAYSDNVLGPYKDVGGPLVQHPYGVIDPTYFQDDDGTSYLIYKIDGNAVGKPTPNYIRRLAPDGLSIGEGAAEVELLSNNPGSWEGGVVEGSWMVKRDGWYYIFYSGNVYDYHYRTGVARSQSLFGPYEKHGGPILSNNGRWVGPGHGSVVQAGSFDYFVYHAWTNNGSGTQNGALGRQILVDRINWQDHWPSISDGTPSTTAQPWPGEAM